MLRTGAPVAGDVFDSTLLPDLAPKREPTAGAAFGAAELLLAPVKLRLCPPVVPVVLCSVADDDGAGASSLPFCPLFASDETFAGPEDKPPVLPLLPDAAKPKREGFPAVFACPPVCECWGAAEAPEGVPNKPLPFPSLPPLATPTAATAEAAFAKRLPPLAVFVASPKLPKRPVPFEASPVPLPATGPAGSVPVPVKAVPAELFPPEEPPAG